MTYFTDEQVKLLLRPIHPRRVLQRDGMSYVEGYDIRAELNRVFGFGRWSEEILDQAQICEAQVKTKNGKDAWYVVYRTRKRLTICAPDGTEVTHYDGSHVGESTHPVRGEAHGNALTNSETYALRRCAINLGDQFGLSLYNKGSLDPIVRWTLVRPEQAEAASTTDTDDVPQVSAEDTGQASPEEGESAAEAFENAEVAHAPRDVSEPEAADEARAIRGGRAAAEDPWQRPWIDMATEQAASFETEADGTNLWKEAAAKARRREIGSDEAERIQALVGARVADLRKAEADELLKPLAADDPWRLKVEELSDDGGAREALEELAQAVTSKSLDMTRANRVSRAIIVRFPKTKTEARAAA